MKPKSTPHESAKCRYHISGCKQSKGESNTICFPFRRETIDVSELSASDKCSAIAQIITLILEFHCGVTFVLPVMKVIGTSIAADAARRAPRE